MKVLFGVWEDEGGFVVSVELILIATIMLIGLLAGMTSIRDAVLSELSDVAGAVQDMNQSYRIYGVRGHSASTSGMDYLDRGDFCDSADDAVNAIDNCITIRGINEIEENGGLIHPPTGS